MVLKPEQKLVKQQLIDTVTLLCRNGLTYNKKLSISAVIGITLDDDDVVLVEIRKTLKKSGGDEETDNSDRESYQSKPSLRKRKSKRKHSPQSSVDSDNENGAKSDQEQNRVGSSFANMAGSDYIKQAQTVDDDSKRTWY